MEILWTRSSTHYRLDLIRAVTATPPRVVGLRQEIQVAAIVRGHRAPYDGFTKTGVRRDPAPTILSPLLHRPRQRGAPRDRLGRGLCAVARAGRAARA